MHERTIKLSLRHALSFGAFSIEFAAMMPANNGTPQRAQLALLDYGDENGKHWLQLPEARVWPIQFVAKGSVREVEGEFRLEVLRLGQRSVQLRISSSRPLHMTHGYVPARVLRVAG